MRAFFAIAVVGTGLLVACAGGTSGTLPTAPTASSLSLASGGGLTLNSNGSDVITIPVAFTIQPSGQAAIQACVGEPVTFSGEARFIAHQTVQPDGTVVLDRIHLNPQGAIAFGSTSGLTYRLVGGDTNEIVTAPGGTLTATFVANLHVVGPGSGFNARIRQHITIAPDGTITALSDVFDVECR